MTKCKQISEDCNSQLTVCHPVRSLLDRDIALSPESVRMLADQSLVHLNWLSSQTRRLLLVEDLVDSLKVRYLLITLCA